MDIDLWENPINEEQSMRGGRYMNKSGWDYYAFTKHSPREIGVRTMSRIDKHIKRVIRDREKLPMLCTDYQP
jgi:hypothetical protein